MQRILITGAAGFIGFHLARRLCADGHPVLGIDNLNSYYDVDLKYARLQQLQGQAGFRFEKADIEDAGAINRLFDDFQPDVVIHLAAHAGVRHSLDNPQAYAATNVTGFLNILEACRHHKVGHLLFASSSSVYGANIKLPYSVADTADHPVSVYAATKKANELLAHTYAHLYGLACTGLRFFTVYGPWGRPDMAYYKFTRALYEGAPIAVFNNGDMKRDFVYIDDIVEGVTRLIGQPPQVSGAPCRLLNMGSGTPVALLDMIRVLEQETGIAARVDMQPIQPGDVPATCADITDLEAAIAFKPATPLPAGLARFVQWYKDYN